MSVSYMVATSLRGAGKHKSKSADILRTVGREENTYGVRFLIDNKILKILWVDEINKSREWAVDIARSYITESGNYHSELGEYLSH